MRRSVAPPSARSTLKLHGVRHSSAERPSAYTPALGSESKRSSMSFGFAGAGAIGFAVGWGAGAGCGAGLSSLRSAYHSAPAMPMPTASAPPTNHTHHGVAGTWIGSGGTLYWLYSAAGSP